MRKVLFTGGGSAGHTVPNLAIIEELLRYGDTETCYIGTDGIEKELVKDWKIPYYTIECPKLVRSLSAWKQNLKIPVAFLRAVKQAKAGLRLFQPDIVFSKGGYVALPVVFAAKSLKIPCIAHESDYSPGLANRISARRCETVFTSFPETAKKLRHGKYSGAPLRRALLTASKTQSRRNLGIPQNANVLLVFGGGSGSRAVNNAIFEHLKTLTKRYFILHVCGKGNLPAYEPENYRAFEYHPAIGELYAAADCLVSRAGAGAVFEAIALKKPTLFIPLEGPTRGDQLQNAKYFADKGLCRILRQRDLANLPQAIDTLFADKALKNRLLQSDFHAGNAVILNVLRGEQ
ncbi:MAG: UDP-N-acetylglucosamine--N-acetylmuramyl-(pentapeptide) pyrophosphoryl-undecaprenol N-acetylglucosamine transferase [Clostridia bacterium]|nr:UDP-N-acetylglucosamine--N-acetylmuramyl-(pentapeptide) pyrophosphoryl-undecaprenol N-acetylglucosamine transferase [Clostridia bacterium]